MRGRVAGSVGRVFVFLGNPCDATQDKDKWMDADKTVEIKLNPLEMDKEDERDQRERLPVLRRVPLRRVKDATREMERPVF